MFPSVMQLPSRCAEGGWVSKHTAQQIGKEERQQSTAAMHLTDCSDNRQGKHSHRERKKMESRCRGREERCKVKDRKRREVKRVKEERGRHRLTIRMDEREREKHFFFCFFYSCIISCLYALTTQRLHSQFYTSCQKQDKWNLRCHETGTAEKGRRNMGINKKIWLCNNNGNTCTICCYQVKPLYNKYYSGEACVLRFLEACVRGVDSIQIGKFNAIIWTFNFELLLLV